MVVLAVLLSMLFPAAATADPTLTFCTDRADFEKVCPDLPIEDFEEANVAAGWVEVCASPVDNTTSNAIFSPGDIEPGLSISQVGPDRWNSAIAVLGAGAWGVPSKSIFPNFFVDSLAIDFTAGDVTCVGMDLLDPVANDPNLQIDIYGASGLLGSTTAPGTTAGSFWGVCSDEVITRIEITSLISGGEGVDNVAFGSGKLPPGWSKGKKSGWDGSRPPGLDKKDKTPPGFEQGNKTGWSFAE